ncbi:MAG: glycine zipper 2TM domain-containing protein [Geopsychrobacter sp.]|nr:glycine zipper 2TM domain-containing protein [Geopsychrobacter sp.]
MKKLSVLFVILTLIIAGCATNVGPKEQGGTLLGAGAGALLGSQIGSGKGRLVAVAIGTLAGALMGQEVGRTLDKADRIIMEQNAQYALEHAPTNSSTPWRNPDSGNAGAITPTKTYQASTGRYCREYHQTVRIGGKEQQAYGTACRQPDGAWKIIR